MALAKVQGSDGDAIGAVDDVKLEGDQGGAKRGEPGATALPGDDQLFGVDVGAVVDVDIGGTICLTANDSGMSVPKPLATGDFGLGGSSRVGWLAVAGR
jgi:hypothetical protein